MEQENIEQATEQAVEQGKEEVLQKQPLDVEAKIDEIATQMVLKIISENEKPISLQAQEELLEKTKRQIRAERAQFISVINEGIAEIGYLNWTHIQAQSLNVPVKGLRGLYFIVFGNFAKTKEDGWIYRPTNEQLLKQVKRFPKKSMAITAAENLRRQLNGTVSDRQAKKESAEMIELKKDLIQQLNEMKENI